MREMLAKFSISRSDDSHINEILSLLDTDGSGEISFEEFYDFGKNLEVHFQKAGNPKGIVMDMFRIFDKDDSGTITVDELHRTMRDIGLDLSVNVIYVRSFSVA